MKSYKQLVQQRFPEASCTAYADCWIVRTVNRTGLILSGSSKGQLDAWRQACVALGIVFRHRCKICGEREHDHRMVEKLEELRAMGYRCDKYAWVHQRCYDRELRTFEQIARNVK